MNKAVQNRGTANSTANSEQLNTSKWCGEGSRLIVAIEKGCEDAALALLEEGADVHAKDADGQTPLHWASDKGMEKVVESLIDRGSRVDELDRFGYAPILLAVKWGRRYTLPFVYYELERAAKG